MSESTLPPGFDPEKAMACGDFICATGNSGLPAELRGCVYWFQTEPGGSRPDPCTLAMGLNWAGSLRTTCAFGEVVVQERCQGTILL